MGHFIIIKSEVLQDTIGSNKDGQEDSISKKIASKDSTFPGATQEGSPPLTLGTLRL